MEHVLIGHAAFRRSRVGNRDCKLEPLAILAVLLEPLGDLRCRSRKLLRERPKHRPDVGLDRELGRTMTRHDSGVEIHLEEPRGRGWQLVAVRSVLLHPVAENKDHVGLSEALEDHRGCSEAGTAEEQPMLVRKRVVMTPTRDHRDLGGLGECDQQLKGSR